MAAREFQRERKWRFYPQEDWEVPTNLAYRSPIAEQYYVACGVSGSTPMCKMSAQYEEYYIHLVVHMDPETMTVRDLKEFSLQMEKITEGDVVELQILRISLGVFGQINRRFVVRLEARPQKASRYVF